MSAIGAAQGAIERADAAANVVAVCPACGRAAGRGALERWHGSDLFACGACDLHFWHPAKMPDGAWYERAYRSRDSTAMPLEPGHRFFLSDAKRPKGGRLLDLGCGVGNFLAGAREAGFEVTGVEVNRNAAEFAREHYRLERVFAMQPEQFRDACAGGKFDVVTFFEVLEHQDDPRGFLRCAMECLKDGGYVGLSVPNRNRWQKGVETLDYPPNHLTRWSPNALRSFLEREGFEILSLREEPLGIERAAQVMSEGLRTQLMSRVAGEKAATLADLAEMKPVEMERAVAEASNGKRHRLAQGLATLKVRALMPAAAVALPYLRGRGYTGLYLYCLAQRKTRGPRRSAEGGER